MIEISVVIITFNEEKNLGRCLDSIIEIADEIIIVDSNSTDQTLAIAARYDARVVHNIFVGYGEQKNFASNKAKHDWILSLDADEALSPELIKSISEFKNNPAAYNVYSIPRITNYCGKWIRHCGWYPDRQTRLFNRTKGSWVEKKVHEFWKANNDNEPKGILKGDLLHYSFSSISEHLGKIEKYSELAALDAVSKGKNASILKIFFSPIWHFISGYFIKLGFLDGFYGYVICRLSAYSALVKYSKIRQYYQRSGTKK